MSKRYLIRRLLLVVPVLLGTMLLVFALVFLTPGDPIARLAGNKPLAPSTYAEITARYHLNQPFVVQYLYYIDGLVHGDLGATFTGRDVTDIIKERLPVTLKLTAGSFAVEVVLGLLLALVAAVKRRTFIDSSILVFTLLMITVPVIVLGFMLQWLFGVKLHWLPVAGVQRRAGELRPALAHARARPRRVPGPPRSVERPRQHGRASTSARRSHEAYPGAASSADTC